MGAVVLALVALPASPATAAGPRQLSIFAGTGNQGSPTTGPATSSDLFEPFGVAVSSSGVAYIADTNNSQVEKVSASGMLSIVAGTGTAGPPKPGPAKNSELNSPYGVALDSAGNLYIADTYNNEIEEVAKSGRLSVVAGTGNEGPPKSGPATESDLDQPEGVSVDSTGDIYIADSGNSQIEEVHHGTLSIVAGTGGVGAPTPGLATASDLFEPGGVTAAPDGGFYIADTFNDTVEYVSTNGMLSLFAGNGSEGEPHPGRALKTPLFEPSGIQVSGKGDVFIAERDGGQLVEVANGRLSITAGNGSEGPPTVGPAKESALGANGVALANSGALFLANPESNEILKITP